MKIISKKSKNFLILLQSEESFPEQLNSYMFLIMQVIDLAKKTNRCLVIPQIHIQPRNAKLAEEGEQDLDKIILGKKIESIETYFNTKNLNNYIETITFENFKKISNKKLELLCCFGKVYNKNIQSYGVTFGIDQSVKLENIYELTEYNSSTVAITGLKRGQNGIKVNPNWHNNSNLDYWQIRKNLVYNDYLIKKAQNFIHENLKNNYLAIHWRRSDRNFYGGFSGDFPETREMMQNQLLSLVKLIKLKMNKHNLKNVFMATDCGTQWHLDFLNEQIPISLYPSSGKWENLQKESIIEQIICMNANHFISAPSNYRNCSSFSRWIIDGRLLMGDTNNISYRKIDNNELFVIRYLRIIKNYFKEIINKNIK